MKSYKSFIISLRVCKLPKKELFIKRSLNSLGYHNIQPEISDKSKPKSFEAKKHVYLNVQPWENVVEFSNYLFNNIVYNENGLVAINKPYGVALTKPNYDTLLQRKVKKTALLSFVPEKHFCLNDALNYLKIKLNMPELIILKCPERYSTGVMLLAEQNGIAVRVQKSIQNAKCMKKSHMTYWCITKGYPKPAIGSEHLGFRIVQMDENKVAQICEYSKSKTKKGEMHSVNVTFRTLNCNKNLSVALVELSSTSAKWHFPRIYMIQRGACILGDTLFSNRITTVLQKTVVLTHPSDAQPSLAIEVCKKLNVPLDGRGFSSIPVSLHLREFYLPNFLQSKKDLIITCPLPEHFQWTCDKLDLLP